MSEKVPFNLKEYRGDKTQEDMARLIGVTVGTWAKRERAGDVPKIWILALKALKDDKLD